MAETTFTLWRQRLGYGIADLSCNLVWQMIPLYLMFFYTDVMGLPAYYVGLMFLVTRLVDGVADVLMGLVIDNTTTRWGRCRPWRWPRPLARRSSGSRRSSPVPWR